MSERPWYKRYPSDFVSGTIMLSAEEKGVYAILLDLMYDKGEAIVDDAQWLGRVCGCTTRRFNQIKQVLADQNKIILRDGFITNNRFEKQHEKEKKEREKLSENGAKGGEKSAEKRADLNENNDLAEKGLEEKTKPNPETRDQIEKKEPKGSSQKGTRIGDWSPGDDGIAYAKQHGLSESQAKFEIEKFRNYFLAAPAQKGVKLDWPATWRNWVLNSKKVQARDGNASASQGSFAALRQRTSVDRLPPVEGAR